MATWSTSGSSGPPHPDFLSALSLTHVQYRANDPLSLAMAYASLVPLGLLCAYATWVIARRELTAVLMLAGQLGNEVVNFACKSYIAQHRPTSFLGTGYGMPSSHAQFMAFFAVFGILHLHT
ncbi:hypothetical protein H4R35_000343 [Dimargaris xerosporica]|nr:hypothetical protein H4R35_000343 [Dimargaris xerosporica]